MKKLAGFLIVILLSGAASAQLISRFTWETNPATAATYGPDAISISSYASSATGGRNATNGLNPGIGRNDINLILNGSYYNIPAIDISVDFRREETVASFYYRGSYFSFGMNGGNLSAKFSLAGGEAFTTVSSGNIYSVPDDHSFHTYRFTYDDNMGTAKVTVDGNIVYTYNGTAGVPLYWTGAGNVTIGKDMDANGNNITVLDNLVIQKYANALLPLQLLLFTAEAKNKSAVLNWSTTKEINTASFIIEKSSTGSSFSPVKMMTATAGYNTVNNYQFTDSLAFSPVSYYRLKMVNNDGSFIYSSVKSVRTAVVNQSAVTVFPNPTVDYVSIKMSNATAGKYSYTVNAMGGQLISASSVQLNNGPQQIKIDLTKTRATGLVVIKLTNTQSGESETFTVIKS